MKRTLGPMSGSNFPEQKKEREIRAFADEIVKKIQVVWEDSLEINPQKKINIVITVSEADSRFG